MNGLSGITDDVKDFDCIAWIKGKMTWGSFQVGHEVAGEWLGQLHSDGCGPMDIPSLGKNHYFISVFWFMIRHITFGLILDKGCTLLKDAGTPNFLWVDAFATAVYAINRSISSSTRNIMPYEAFFS